MRSANSKGTCKKPGYDILWAPPIAMKNVIGTGYDIPQALPIAMKHVIDKVMTHHGFCS